MIMPFFCDQTFESVASNLEAMSQAISWFKTNQMLTQPIKIRNPPIPGFFCKECTFRNQTKKQDVTSLQAFKLFSYSVRLIYNTHIELNFSFAYRNYEQTCQTLIKVMPLDHSLTKYRVPSLISVQRVGLPC